MGGFLFFYYFIYYAVSSQGHANAVLTTDPYFILNPFCIIRVEFEALEFTTESHHFPSFRVQLTGALKLIPNSSDSNGFKAVLSILLSITGRGLW